MSEVFLLRNGDVLITQPILEITLNLKNGYVGREEAAYGIAGNHRCSSLSEAVCFFPARVR